MSKPKIVILDGYTTNPGDLSWDELSKLGDLTVYDYTKPEEVIERASGADVVISNKVVWTRENMEQLPSCRLICLLATGYNVVDCKAARDLGITVCNVPAYSTPDVAQHTMALILETTNHVVEYASSVREGAWAASPDFVYYLEPLIGLAGKTLGIIGMGSIGQAVAKLALAFDMEVIFENPHPRPQAEGPHCRQVELDELLATADIVTLHCPVTPETTGLVNAELLAKMKPGSRLVNASRGGLVKSADIAAALESGQLYWYAADVAEHEPMPLDDPLRTAPRTTITPHVAWATRDARTRLIAQVSANVAAFLAGKPVNVVN